MNTRSVLTGLALVVIAIGFYSLNRYIYTEKQDEQQVVRSHKDTTYIIAGKPVQLTNGIAEIEMAPGSAQKIVTEYLGNELAHDVDEDGRQDIVFLLTQKIGSQVIYYAAAALNKEGGYVGSQAHRIGDRIAPVSVAKGKDRIVVVEYLDRGPREDIDAVPTIKRSAHLLMDKVALEFNDVAPDFQGEVDPKRLTLEMKTWTWIKAEFRDGREIVPRPGPKIFNITFSRTGRFSAASDCNTFSGTYVVGENSQLTFKEIFSTKMFCEGSQEMEYINLIGNTNGYRFNNRGELELILRDDSGTVIFR